MKNILIAVVAAFTLVACTDAESAKSTLTKAGYSDVEITGYDWFACSKDDTYHTGFKAKGPTGIPVAGVVCKGFWTKASTIRIED